MNPAALVQSTSGAAGRWTWESVGAAYQQASQMATQTVEAFAKIGDMLMALKEEIPHGLFTLRCAEVFGKTTIADCGFTKAQLHTAQVRASAYMRLARERQAWEPHNPGSLNEAMKMLPKKQPATQPTAKPIGWTKAVVKLIGEFPPGWRAASIDGKSRARDRLEAEIGFTIPRALLADDPKVKVIADAILKLSGTAKTIEEAQAKVAPSQKEKFERELRKATLAYHKILDAQFEEAVAKRTKELNERALAECVRYNELADGMTERLKKAPAYFSVEEFRMIRGLLHPDKHPGEEHKYRKAFEVFNRIEAHVFGVMKRDVKQFA